MFFDLEPGLEQKLLEFGRWLRQPISNAALRRDYLFQLLQKLWSIEAAIPPGDQIIGRIIDIQKERIVTPRLLP